MNHTTFAEWVTILVVHLPEWAEMSGPNIALDQTVRSVLAAIAVFSVLFNLNDIRCGILRPAYGTYINCYEIGCISLQSNSRCSAVSQGMK